MICPGCKEDKPETADHWQRDASIARGFRVPCKSCRKHRPRVPDPDPDPAPSDRLESDYEALRPEDFDVGALNPGQADARASREKRQEYSKLMGAFARNLAADELDGRDGAYIGGVAEQERRFQNRRMARTVSLTAANEALFLRQFKAAAAEYLSDKIEPKGFATRPATEPAQRTTVLFLSDLHIGAELSEYTGDPIPFTAIQEARRLEFLVRQTLEFKPQHRAKSSLLLILGGDVIEGMLLHDIRDGAPLTEQQVAFWRYMSTALALFARAFPSVRVVCQPGNHGRNIARHPGRATSTKWDSIEWAMYYGLKMMSRGLRNVTFDISLRSMSIVDLHGSILGITHGDTEVKLGAPDIRAAANKTEWAKVNAYRVYDVEFDAVCVGHYHTPGYHPGRPDVIYNGALVPPNGHARSKGYIGEQCGQFLWEAIEGFPVGDVRYLRVGRAQDEDENLGKVIQPFRFRP